MPLFPGFLALLGPGIIWMGVAQGSGELILWPYLVAKYGLGFVCLLIPACLLQYPVTFEIGRYSALTGESVWKGFVRLHPCFGLLMWVVMLVTFIWLGAYVSASGTALAELTNFPPGCDARGRSLSWAVFLVVLYTCLLLRRRDTYRFLKVLMWIVAAASLAGLAVSAVHPDVVASMPEFFHAIIFPQPLARPWQSSDADTFITALVYAGMGGLWSTFYSYWILGEGVMRTAGAGEAALPQADEAVLREQAPKWRRYLLFDAGIGIFGNIITTILTCLLAYAFLFPQGLIPEGWRLAVEQARFFEASWGIFGRALFLFIAACFLADIWPAVVDFFIKVNREMCSCFCPAWHLTDEVKFYRYSLIGLALISIVTVFLKQPGMLIVLAGVLSFLIAPVLNIAIFVMIHYRLNSQLALPLRAGMTSYALLLGSSVVYLGLAAVYLWAKFVG